MLDFGSDRAGQRIGVADEEIAGAVERRGDRGEEQIADVDHRLAARSGCRRGCRKRRCRRATVPPAVCSWLMTVPLSAIARLGSLRDDPVEDHEIRLTLMPFWKVATLPAGRKSIGGPPMAPSSGFQSRTALGVSIVDRLGGRAGDGPSRRYRRWRPRRPGRPGPPPAAARARRRRSPRPPTTGAGAVQPAGRRGRQALGVHRALHGQRRVVKVTSRRGSGALAFEPGALERRGQSDVEPGAVAERGAHAAADRGELLRGRSTERSGRRLLTRAASKKRKGCEREARGPGGTRLPQRSSA